MVFSEQETELLPFVKQNDVSSTLLASQSSKHEDYSKPDKRHRWGSLSKGWRFTVSLFKGWKFTLFLACVSSIVVLSLNLGFLIYASAHPHDGDNTIIYEGDCRKTKTLSLVYHVLINALSTALLVASNFGMVNIPLLFFFYRR